jgi:hypothetical protein
MSEKKADESGATPGMEGASIANAAWAEALRVHPPTDECPGQECGLCGARDCPHGNSLHYHPYGCPDCDCAEPKPRPVNAEKYVPVAQVKNLEKLAEARGYERGLKEARYAISLVQELVSVPSQRGRNDGLYNVVRPNQDELNKQLMAAKFEGYREARKDSSTGLKMGSSNGIYSPALGVWVDDDVHEEAICMLETDLAALKRFFGQLISQPQDQAMRAAAAEPK